MTSARFQADFTGRLICVSGGATGIGAATARMSAAAGPESGQKATGASVQHWERVINVNLTGVFLVCRTALRHICPHGAGSGYAAGAGLLGLTR